MKTQQKLECLGGPLCGSYAPDTKELWLGIQSVKNPDEEHYYKRIRMDDVIRGKSCLLWHYHGPDPDKPGVPILKPARRKFQ
jgi:hypothetical protein